METTSIWKLPAQALPYSKIDAPILATIWLFLTTLLTYVLRRLGKASHGAPWQEFNLAIIASGLLIVWYLVITVDGWLHFDRREVPYGYVISMSAFESLRVASTMLYIWATYKLVWRRSSSTVKFAFIWWLAARFVFFVVMLMAFYYLTLYLAQSVAWLEFLSLNVIADIATKRTHFEIAMAALVFGFTLLTVVAALKDWGSSKQVNGRADKTQKLLAFAALALCCRSLEELVLATFGRLNEKETRQSLKTPHIGAYGGLSIVFLSLICVLAFYSRDKDSGVDVAGVIQSDVRKFIINHLERVTQGARVRSPQFGAVVEMAKENAQLDSLLQRRTSIVETETGKGIARSFCDQLATKFQGNNPPEDLGQRGPSRLSAALRQSRSPRQAGRSSIRGSAIIMDPGRGGQSPGLSPRSNDASQVALPLSPADPRNFTNSPVEQPPLRPAPNIASRSSSVNSSRFQTRYLGRGTGSIWGPQESVLNEHPEGQGDALEGCRD
ncbi:hypothetical protein MKZ38_001345 [Zalerion maritima]|uniref:Uncharacterized protein n=1 Tax=Zalerion maritima TaxID=339359 RepID=A0AAD5RQY5_9PEZI|nr:hypothetical protein MKZ38_001345 [Zalerion maritima]